VSMRMRALLAWIAVGLVGLALAAGVTYAATQLSSQRIGLSAEPPSAGEELAPPRPAHHAPATTPSTRASAPTTPDARSDDDRRGREEHGEAGGRADWDD